MSDVERTLAFVKTYRCPSCGTGRWHAKGCPEGAPDGMFDEMSRALSEPSPNAAQPGAMPTEGDGHE